MISSALHGVRGSFDLMPTEGEEAAANIAARLAAVPAALDQWQRDAAARPPRRATSRPAQQIIEVAKQCEVWAGPDGDDF